MFTVLQKQLGSWYCEVCAVGTQPLNLERGQLSDETRKGTPGSLISRAVSCYTGFTNCGSNRELACWKQSEKRIAESFCFYKGALLDMTQGVRAIEP